MIASALPDGVPHRAFCSIFIGFLGLVVLRLFSRTSTDWHAHGAEIFPALRSKYP
jgi:hypothetical protein